MPNMLQSNNTDLLYVAGAAKKYRKIPIISPELKFVQKAVLLAYSRGSLFSEGLIIRRNFAFQIGFMRLGLTIKNSLKHYKNSLKKLALKAGFHWRRNRSRSRSRSRKRF